MKAHHNPLTTLASFYVGSSRHKDNLAIVTDDTEKLLEIISEKLEMENEIISFREPPNMRAQDNTQRDNAQRDNTQSIELGQKEDTQEHDKSLEIEHSQEQSFGMGM